MKEAFNGKMYLVTFLKTSVRVHPIGELYRLALECYCWMYFEFTIYFSCFSNNTVVYQGERCEKVVSLEKSTPTSDPISLSKMTIIAIAGGVGGGLLLILIITVACFCYRSQNGKRHGYVFSSFFVQSCVRANWKLTNWYNFIQLLYYIADYNARGHKTV